MPKKRIPSPARSQRALMTPRRNKNRSTRSLGSPAVSNTSGRLTSIIQFKEKHMNSFILSPVNNRRSILTDDTDIEEPRRKSWWKKLDENSRDVMEILESNNRVETDIEELVDIEVLSQEKKNYTMELPDSSESESISSIVIPQRKLFTQKESQPKNFAQILGNRETMAKLNKTNALSQDKTITAGTKNLFNQRPKRTKPVFPAALLNISASKPAADKTKEFIPEEPKTQVRNIFGNRQATKRKNMFANFILSESEDDIPEIQPKVFRFPKKIDVPRKSSASNGARDHSPTSSITAELEIDDWRLLPSSTMVENQLEEMVASTPVKKPKLSKLSEAKETEVTTDNKSSISNRSRSTKNKSKSSSEKDMSLEKGINQNVISSKSFAFNNSKIPEQNSLSKDLNISRNKSKLTGNKSKGEASSSQIKTIRKSLNVSRITGVDHPKDNEQMTPDADQVENDGDENNFTLEYPNDSEESEKDISKKSSDQEFVDDEKNEDSNERTNMSEPEKQNESFNEQDNYEDQDESIQNASQNEEEQDGSVTHEETYNDTGNKSDQQKQLENEQSNTMENDDDQEEMEVDGNNDQFANDSISKHSELDISKNDSLVERDNNPIENEQIHEAAKITSPKHTQLIKDQGNKSRVSVAVKVDTNNHNQLNESQLDMEDVETGCNQSQEEVSNEHHESYINKSDMRNDSCTEEENNEQNDSSNEEGDQSQVETDENEESIEKSKDNGSDAEEEIDSDLAESENNISVENNEEENELEADSNNGVSNESEGEQNKSEDNLDVDIIDQVSQEEIDGTPNDLDTTGRNRQKNAFKDKSPEAILHDKTNQIDSFTAHGRNTSIRKTKSMLKHLNIRPSLAPLRESVGFSDGTKDSSAEGSGWDSHRTTRKTIRQTMGKDFSIRKSLRALVMEKSAKSRTEHNADNTEFVKDPQANSTEYLEESYRDQEIVEDSNRDIEPIESDHEVSRRTRQTTLESYLQKIKMQNLEKKNQMEEAVRNSIKAPAKDVLNPFKIPANPFPLRKPKAAQGKPQRKAVKPLIHFDELPIEVVEDMKYKPPKRFQPSSASWITKRLYKFLEGKLEAKYDYKARVRAEKLVETIYHFAKDLRRLDVASTDAVDVLKHEMARLDIVQTHFDFYQFFHDFMPREVRVKVVPDLVNGIQLPRHGVFTHIVKSNAVQR